MKGDVRFKATMYMLDASVSSDTPLHDLLEGFGKQVLAEQQGDLAEARALLAELPIESMSPARRCDDALIDDVCRDDDGPCWAHRCKALLARRTK